MEKAFARTQGPVLSEMVIVISPMLKRRTRIHMWPALSGRRGEDDIHMPMVCELPDLKFNRNFGVSTDFLD